MCDGIQRVAHERVGAGDVVVVEAGALRPEEHRGAQAPRIGVAQILGGGARGAERLDHVAEPRAGGEDAVAVGERRGQVGEDGGGFEDAVGAGRHPPRALLRPAVARRDEPEMEQAAIRHGARGGADVLRELRPDQHDDRRLAGRRGEVGAAVAPGHARRQVVPCGPSSSTTPSAASRSRMRSASAKSRALRAAARAAMAASMRSPSASPRSQRLGIGRPEAEEVRRLAERRSGQAGRQGPVAPDAAQHRSRRAADARHVLQRAQVAQARQRERRVQVVEQRLRGPLDHLRDASLPPPAAPARARAWRSRRRVPPWPPPARRR